MWKINKMHKLNINKYVDTENGGVRDGREGVGGGEGGGGGQLYGGKF